MGKNILEYNSMRKKVSEKNLFEQEDEFSENYRRC